ncbi:hypothetical protein PR202_gb20634 [Eleusine coracana subsp. coracana]|uniref:Uncharacterized protein n=1 Tax=Eleusine coracana subsp. coracana TaxID=191504 RepID=A0AAV5F914_ELECO|nr:hypothetical protein PR202_gb20634 [Eleusine coracana subsp. coracana]
MPLLSISHAPSASPSSRNRALGLAPLPPATSSSARRRLGRQPLHPPNLPWMTGKERMPRQDPRNLRGRKRESRAGL